ncbi:laminin subunit alpha-like [Branchiostoma floridae]|uniref:Laminin subunit alpha-like n=1 Tax=Branchiostoma floridae TaxID=7739 RepID=A0A9J7KMD3_BRAFL|nr:laminin subunit alpha-like [Branchiostoma floridae]
MQPPFKTYKDYNQMTNQRAMAWALVQVLGALLLLRFPSTDAGSLECTTEAADDICEVSKELFRKFSNDLNWEMRVLKDAETDKVVLERLTETNRNVSEEVQRWVAKMTKDTRKAIMDSMPIDFLAEKIAVYSISTKNSATMTEKRSNSVLQRGSGLKDRRGRLVDDLEEHLSDTRKTLRQARQDVYTMQSGKVSNFNPILRRAYLEKVAAEETRDDSKSWVITRIRNKEVEFTKSLDDLAQQVDRADEKVRIAEQLNAANADRPRRDLMNTVHGEGNSLIAAVSAARRVREDVERALDGAKELKNILKNNSRQTVATIAMYERVQEVGDMSVVENRTEAAKQHAEYLLNKTRDIEWLRSSGGIVSQKALQALVTYQNVADMIKEADKFSAEALTFENISDIKIRNPKRKSSIWMDQALGRKSTVDDGLKPRADALMETTATMTWKLHSGRDQLKNIEAALNRCRSPDPPIYRKKKINRSKRKVARANAAIEDIISGKYLVDVGLSKHARSVSNLEEALRWSERHSIKEDLADTKSKLSSMHSSIAEAKEIKEELQMQFAYTSAVVDRDRVTESIKAIQDMIRKARYKAAQIAIPMNFGRTSIASRHGTAVRLEQPEVLENLSNHKNYFTLSLDVKPKDHDGTILFIGDPKNATGDYFGLELVAGKVRASFDLSGGSGRFFVSAYRTNLALDSWCNIKVERVGNFAKVKVESDITNLETSGTDGSNYILFDLPRDAGIWVGGVPEGSNLPENMALEGKSFTGNIDNLKIGEIPISLWNFREHHKMLSPTVKPDRKMKASKSYRSVYLDGSAYSYTNPDRTSSVDIFKQENIVQMMIRPVSEESLLFFLGDKSYYISLELLANRLVAKTKLGSGNPPAVVQSDNTVTDMLKQLSIGFIQITALTNTATPQCDGHVSQRFLALITNQDVKCVEMELPSDEASQEIGSQAYIGGLPPSLRPNEISSEVYEGCVKNLHIQRMYRQIEIFNGGIIGGCPSLVQELHFTNPDTNYLEMAWVSGRSVYRNFDATFAFQTSLDSGLMLYVMGDTEKNSWAVSMTNGSVMFAMFGDPTGEAKRMTSVSRYDDGKEHYVRVSKEGTRLTMHIDDKRDIPATEVEDTLLQTPHLLLGGVAPGMAPLTTGQTWLVDSNDRFVGCMKHLLVSYDNTRGEVIDFVNKERRQDVTFGSC